MNATFKTKHEALASKPNAKYLYVFTAYGQTRWSSSQRLLKIATGKKTGGNNPEVIELFNKRDEEIVKYFQL